MFLTDDGRTRLRRLVDDSVIRAGDLEQYAAAAIRGAADRDGIERLFRRKAFKRFLEAYPRSGAVWFGIMATALFEAARDAADGAVLDRLCACLRGERFTKGMDRYVRRDLPKDEFYDVIRDILRAAKQSAHKAAAVIDLAGSGVYRTLALRYGDDFPSALRAIRAALLQAVMRGLSERVIGDLIDFLVEEDLYRLIELSDDEAMYIDEVVEPLLSAAVQEFSVVEKESAEPLPDDDAAIAEERKRHRYGIAVRLRSARTVIGAATAGLPPKRRKPAKQGLWAAMVPFLTPAGRGDDGEPTPFFAFLSEYGWDKEPAGPAIWTRLFAAPSRVLPELPFFLSDAFRGFARKASAAGYNDGMEFFVDFVMACADDSPSWLSGSPPRHAGPSLLIADNGLLRERAFLEARLALYRHAEAATGSRRLRALNHDLFLADLTALAGGQTVRKPDGIRLTRLVHPLHRFVEAALAPAAYDRESGQTLEDAIKAVYAKCWDFLWENALTRLTAAATDGDGRAAALSVRTLIRQTDLDDEALTAIEALDDTTLGLWMENILKGANRVNGKDVARLRLEIAERLHLRYHFRISFATAYPYIMETLISILGTLRCEEDLAGNWAKTDGRVIWLPRWIDWFDTPPDRLPDNLNLTVFIGLALHEAGHIIGGSFVFDLRPLAESMANFELFKQIHNAFEDFRIERYLRLVKPHAQTKDILDTVNLHLYSEPSASPLFNFLMGAVGLADDYWPILMSRNPRLRDALDSVWAAPYPCAAFADVRSFADYLIESLDTMDVRDPTAGVRLSLEAYDIIKDWPIQEAFPPPTIRRTVLGGNSDAGSSMNVDPAGESRARALADRAALEEALREFLRDPEQFYAENGLPVFPGAFAAPEPVVPDKPLPPALWEADDGRLKGLIDETLRTMREFSYRQTGRAAAGRYGAADAAGAQRQLEGRDGTAALPADGTAAAAAAARKDRRGRNPVRRRAFKGHGVKDHLLLSACEETLITAIDRRFLTENRRYRPISIQIARLLRAALEDMDSNELEVSEDDGDIDPDRLVELVADHNSPQSYFLEAPEESRKSLSVVIGLDASGSTASASAPSASAPSASAPSANPVEGRPRTTTILDVEKHFALIFARALKLLSDDIAVLAYNSDTGTNIYRLEPPEAVSSLIADNSNRDGDFVRYCAMELKRKGSDIKYLFLITDGQPCAVGYEGKAALDDTTAAFLEAGRDGIQVVYLNIDSVRRPYFDEFAAAALYARHFSQPEELIQVVPELVRKIVREVL